MKIYIVTSVSMGSCDEAKPFSSESLARAYFNSVAAKLSEVANVTDSGSVKSGYDIHGNSVEIQIHEAEMDSVA